ncbi:DUF445 family protein [Paenibacillus motobuensis]|uniref:DUF445 domain-containing protein n=1 Tax=Paenibacillus TaxID=44249 RepID=UPI00203AA9F4|nr:MULTISPECIES: DUF445 family protein [Paenibacillus]MCM3038657.1 DUF445 family protein [Paenibacillus lutimineralis]MCM3645761.1 DUF445 family protein [Paenibacillus motobuensis]
MNPWIYIMVSVAVAAFVGGITNHFAIKMLFHPRKKIMIGRFRVPFTPGLIPKRREDIAQSLGNVVADYLVTPEGLQDMVLRPSFKQKVEDYLRALLYKWTQSPLTLKEAALTVWDEDKWEAIKLKLTDTTNSVLEHGMDWLWNQYGLGEKAFKEVIPGWTEENRERWSEIAAEALLRTIEEELLSAGGQRMLSKMAAGLADQAGGFLGTMAAIFMDEDKMVRKLTPALVRALRGDETREKVARAIKDKLEEYAEKPVNDLLQLLANEEGKDWIISQLQKLPLDKWISKAEELKLSSLLASWKPQLENAIPGFTDRMLRGIVRGIPVVMTAIQLPKLVHEQVQKFPIELLEEVILSVSGKEFRAITWLGVVLGGMIGLLQSLFMLWWR